MQKKPAKTADEKFAEYDKAHPEIYRQFRRFTFVAIYAGFTHFSAYLIRERIRWYTMMEVKEDGFKLNNNYTSRYARKFMEDYPKYKGFFRTRVLRS